MFPSRIPILIGLCLIPAPGFAQSRAHDRHSWPLTGTYARIKSRADENQSAILDIRQRSGSRIRFHLTALWWPVGRSDSPHNGEIEATVALHDHVAVYKDGDYRLTLRFRDHKVVLTESGSNPDFGANVSAAGTYRRTGR